MSDFSSNSHSRAYCRYPSTSFVDGDLVLLTGEFYFIVQRKIINCQSSMLGELEPAAFKLEGHPVLHLEDSADDLSTFLLALHNGISSLRYDWVDFSHVSALLRLSTTYSVKHLRAKLLAGLAVNYPTTLQGWDAREKALTSLDPSLIPYAIPHPLLVLQMAREIQSYELMIPALFDLSRHLPSQIAAGIRTQGDHPVDHKLTPQELYLTLRGREAASRYLSTFIVKHLESRPIRDDCPQKRRCQMSFEAVTFDLIRDINGLLCSRNSDVLFAISETLSMLLAQDGQGGIAYGVCSPCLEDYAAEVDGARNEIWSSLPEWFAVKVDTWG